MSSSTSIATGASAVAHELHAATRVWPETNCYLDLWIELLHSLGLDPTPMLAVCAVADFEGDQWTFCKPSHDDLFAFYGIVVDEMTVWRPLIAHVTDHVHRGRIVLVETDAFYLPDTAGVSYGIGHAKTTIAVVAIDANEKRAEYFHNAGRFTIHGDDFNGVFGTAARDDSRNSFPLPPFAELVNMDVVTHRPARELAALAETALVRVMARRPADNPIARYRAQLDADVATLNTAGMSEFHEYAFATVRQCGACAELASSFLEWLDGSGDASVRTAATAFAELASDAKTLQFKLARAVATGATQSAIPVLDRMESAWGRAMGHLAARYGA